VEREREVERERYEIWVGGASHGDGTLGRGTCPHFRCLVDVQMAQGSPDLTWEWIWGSGRGCRTWLSISYGMCSGLPKRSHGSGVRRGGSQAGHVVWKCC
jgi:hypothetical protein